MAGFADQHRWGRARLRGLVSERGQDIVEYAGVLVLVAAIIAAVVAAGVPTLISHRVDCLAQQLLGDGDLQLR